uniref:Mini-chromosome maintenance complex-binding protein n=2 Tax=Mesocestoides corti TaxID=53468 RepID=A0A5K3EXZ9_MESCO
MESHWLVSPLTTFDQHFQNDEGSFEDFMKQKILTSSDQVIPLLTEDSLPRISDGHLVCFQGMVQDMFDSELYMSSYKHVGVDVVSSTRYRDVEYLKFDAALDEKSITFASRQSFYVCSLPGASDWFKASLPTNVHLPSTTLGVKRSVGRTDSKENIPVKKFAGEIEELKAEEIQEKTGSNPSGILLRVYNEKTAEVLKLTDIVIVFGILEHARLGGEETESEGNGKKTNLPRVHAIVVEKTTFRSHPCLQDQWKLMGDNFDIHSGRNATLSLLKSALKGDELAAEYTLLHLLSTSVKSVSAFPMMLPPLNICRWNPSFTEHLASTLSDILPQLSTLEVSIESLNTGPPLLPVHNVAKGELEPGLLQLPSGSQILADETRMSTGQLTSVGVLNCRVLTTLAVQRKLMYDFQFYTRDWEADVRVLLLSSSCPSIIKPSLVLPLQNVLEEEARSVLDPLSLSLVRRLLLQAVPAEETDYSIESELQQIINQDFVNWRKDNSTHIEVDDFAVMLVLLKLYVLSCGRSIPTVEDWKAIVKMETERRRRLREIFRGN